MLLKMEMEKTAALQEAFQVDMHMQHFKKKQTD